MKLELLLLAVILVAPSPVFAQPPARQWMYVGGMGGIATLSGDASNVVTPSSASTSSFDPSNGGAGEAFVGIHFFQYVSFEADYVWNRNDTVLVSTAGGPGALNFFREPESITQNAFLGNVLVYFRKRGSLVRPYVCEGGGAVLIDSRLLGGAVVQGSPMLPPATSDRASVALRTSVGIDVRLRRFWYFRYSFGETITGNPLGDPVSPALHRIPKNFQSLFGVYFRF